MTERIFKNMSPALLCAVCIIAAAYLGVLAVGLSVREPMIGDEVIHYYMLVHQAEQFPAPTVEAHIPLGTGETIKRYYPHVFLWHYIGSLFWKFSGGKFWAVQFYQSLFWLQYLIAGLLLARQADPEREWGMPVYTAVLASLPISLIFSVAFYQDVAAAAQIMTAFYLLRKGRWALASLFLGLALALKVTVFIMIPAFFACVLVFGWRRESVLKLFWKVSLALLIIAAMCWPMAKGLHYCGFAYYPTTMIQLYAGKLGLIDHLTVVRSVKPGDTEEHRVNLPVAGAKGVEEVVNHPGDLRMKKNWLIYFGGLLWLVGAGGLIAAAARRKDEEWRAAFRSGSWSLAAGVWYILFTALHMRNSPDARFFLPGAVFVILPLAIWFSRWPMRKLWLPLLLGIALLQTGAVLAKTYALRRISPELQQAIDFLKENPPLPNGVFMYPEGNHRLFTVRHDWYLGFRLKDFWKADNDGRMDMLRERDLGAIVIKKYLIGHLDDKMTNLGIYPDYFVRDIARDDRFSKVFENSDFTVYTVPAE
ncbi:MAG: hypothetical protein AB7T27_04415 [Kiritimatiellia bacterium]